MKSVRFYKKNLDLVSKSMEAYLLNIGVYFFMVTCGHEGLKHSWRMSCPNTHCFGNKACKNKMCQATNGLFDTYKQAVEDACSQYKRLTPAEMEFRKVEQHPRPKQVHSKETIALVDEFISVLDDYSISELVRTYDLDAIIRVIDDKGRLKELTITFSQYKNIDDPVPESEFDISVRVSENQAIALGVITERPIFGVTGVKSILTIPSIAIQTILKFGVRFAEETVG